MQGRACQRRFPGGDHVCQALRQEEEVDGVQAGDQKAGRAKAVGGFVC